MIEYEKLKEKLDNILSDANKDINNSKIGVYEFPSDYEFGMAIGWKEACQFVIYHLEKIEKEECV